MSKSSIPRSMQAEVFQRDGYRCRYCGSVDGPFELDHVYPEAAGGRTIPENLAVACRPCNQLKRDTIGMWPFPVGHFDEGVSIPIGEGRYRSYLLVASAEIDHSINHLEKERRVWVELAHSMLHKKDRDNNDLIIGQYFVRLVESASAIVSRLAGAQAMLKATTHPSKARAFLLTLTGQKPPMVDLVAFLAVVEKADQDIGDLMGNVRTLAPKETDAADNMFFVQLAQTAKTLADCRSSLEMVIALLEQAQLSIVPERSY